MNKEANLKLGSKVAYRSETYIVLESHGHDEYTIKKVDGKKTLKVKRFSNTLCKI